MTRGAHGKMRVRLAGVGDAGVVGRMFRALWPDGSLAEHTKEARAILAGKAPSTLPLVVLVAEVDGRVVGFVEVGLRSHADGCDARRAVGFLEGWYVARGQRRRGVGRALVRAAERWARAQGCREMASDTWAKSRASQRAHTKLGFEVVDRVVNFRRKLR